MRAASGISRIIDRRRPHKLTRARRAEIGRHPEVKWSHRRLQKISNYIKETHDAIRSVAETSMHDEYQRVSKNHLNLKRRLEKAFLKDVIARYEVE